MLGATKKKNTKLIKDLIYIFDFYTRQLALNRFQPVQTDPVLLQRRLRFIQLLTNVTLVRFLRVVHVLMRVQILAAAERLAANITHVRPLARVYPLVLA